MAPSRAGEGGGWFCSSCTAPAVIVYDVDSPDRCAAASPERSPRRLPASPAFDDTVAGGRGGGRMEQRAQWEEAPPWAVCTAGGLASDTRSSGSTCATGGSGGAPRTAAVSTCPTLVDTASSSEEEDDEYSEGVGCGFGLANARPRARPQRPAGVDELRAKLAKDRLSRELPPEHEQALDDRRHAQLSAEAAIESGDWWQLQAAMQLVAGAGLGNVWAPRLHEAMREVSRRQDSRLEEYGERAQDEAARAETAAEALQSPLLQAALGTYHHRSRAARELREAAKARDEGRLREAIAAAQSQRVRQLELDRAREVLRALEAAAAVPEAHRRGHGDDGETEDYFYRPPDSAPIPACGLYAPGLDFQPLWSSPALLQPPALPGRQRPCVLPAPPQPWPLPAVPAAVPPPAPAYGGGLAPVWGWR